MTQGSLPSQRATHTIRGFNLLKVEMDALNASPTSALLKVLFGPFLQHHCLPQRCHCGQVQRKAVEAIQVQRNRPREDRKENVEHIAEEESTARPSVHQRIKRSVKRQLK